MKRVIGIAIIVILLASVTGAFLLINNGTQGGSSTSSTANLSTSNNFVSVDACDVLTPAIAKQTLGDNTTKASLPNTAVSSADITVSTCSYVSNAVPSGDVVTTPKSSGVWLIIRVAKTAAGADSNKAQFESDKPANVQAVNGLGDTAFYNDQFRQLNVLKGNNWYVITSYKDSILNGSLASNKAVAEKLQFK